MSDRTRAHPAEAASSTERPNGSYRAGLTKTAARCIRARKALCERSPIKVSSPGSLAGELDLGPATNTGQSSPCEARASAETFLAVSHNRPAARMKRRFEFEDER